MPIHVFQKKLNYAKNISESCHNGNAKLLNVLKFYFDLKERHDKLYYSQKISPFNISRLTNMNDMKKMGHKTIFDLTCFYE